MELIKPDKKYLESYYQGCVESWGQLHDNYIIHNPAKYNLWKETIFDDFKNQEKGINLPKGFVPNITFWLIDEDNYVGSSNIRLFLTEELMIYGDNCGFAVIPSKRGVGYGKKILELTLKKMRELEISPIILTSKGSNLSSIKVIEKFNYINKNEYLTAVNGKISKVIRYSF